MLIANNPFEPVIKWSGSKRSVAASLRHLFPRATRYFEPFVGGGAMLPFRPCHDAMAGDVIKELIDWANETKSTLVVATHDRQVAQKFHTQWRMSFGSLKAGEL